LFGAAVMPEHLHIVISLKPTDAPYKPMQYIKGRLSRELRAEFGDLPGDSLWADGYYVEAVGKKNVWQVLHYIARQDEHHGDPP
jgi:putative transposase